MKFNKVLAILALASACCACAVAGCTSSETKTVEGDYHYVTDYGTYGVKVSVEVQNDKIKKVTILDSDYTLTTSADYGFADSVKWDNGVNALLDTYADRSVASVLDQKVTVGADSVPTAVDNSAFVVSGATQSSGRLLLAVQDALKKL